MSVDTEVRTAPVAARSPFGAAVVIGFTGTQEGMTTAQGRSFRSLLLALFVTEFHHGLCVGADAEAHAIARQLPGVRIVGHPCTIASKQAPTTDCDELRPVSPPLVRNRNIVAETDGLIACPKSEVEERRSGTWATVRWARRTGKPLWLIVPDGWIKKSEATA